MAISTYAELQTAVGNWLNRSDLSARIPEFIELGDARIRREQRFDRRVFTTENGGVGASITSDGQALAANVLDVLALWEVGAAALDRVDFVELQSLKNSNGDGTGTPRVYALLPSRAPATEGPRVYFWPRPSGTFTIDFLFIRDVGKLSASGSSILSLHPDLYMWAALAESAPFLKHDERVQLWESKFQNALASMNGAAERISFSGPVRVRLSRVFS